MLRTSVCPPERANRSQEPLELSALLCVRLGLDQGAVAELAQIAGRAQPNLTRALAKLEAAGSVRMKPVGRRTAPSAAIKKIVVEINPFSDNDRLRVA